MTAHFDAIVIGGGSAGSAAVRRLHDAGLDVALLEAGGWDTNPAIHEPRRMHELWLSEDDWGYFSTPQRHAAGRRLHLPRGKVLGGSHALNGMIYVRCSPADFDQWAELGNEGWAWDDVFPIYRAMERYEKGASELRGGDGPLDVIRDYRLNAVQQAVIEAGIAAGIPYNDDYNGETVDGISSQQVTMRDGKRLTSYGAYVKPILDSARLTVETGAWVHRLLFDDGRAVGVEVEQRGELRALFADEIVLSAGSFDTPRILMRSGIGPADHLRELGLPVLIDRPAVGRNLQDHFLAPVIFTTDAKPVPPIEDGMGIMQSHFFWRSTPGLRLPDVQPVHFSTPAYEPWMTGPENGFTLMAGLVTPRSRGSVRLSGPEPHDPILIDLGLYSDPEDLETMLAAVRLCERIGASAPLTSEWGARQLYPESTELGDDELRDYIRRATVTYHHAAGTCRMGVDDEAVVTPRLEVRGVPGLRIADASIMPFITAGNTNAPAILIGEQVARFMLAD